MRTIPLSWIFIALGFTALAFAVRWLPIEDEIRRFNQWVEDLGPAGIAAFIAAYVLLTVALIPPTILTLGAGLAFGLFSGIAIVYASSLIGCTAAFLIARYIAREKVAKRFAKNRRFQAIDRAVEKNGAKIIVLMRLTPLTPFNISNYVYGITAIRFWPYLGASAIGMIPGTVAWVYIGYIGKASIDALLGKAGIDRVLFNVVILFVTVIAGFFLIRIARKALRKADREVQEIQEQT